MKKINFLFKLIAAVLFLALPARAQLVVDFDDILYWIGSGSNQAALVIDWSDGKSVTSYAWGYRWDGSATGLDMLNAVAAADTRLEINFHPSFPTALYSVFYDADGDGGSYTFTAPGVETGTTSDPDDHYREGWFSGFWNYSVNSTSAPGDLPYSGGNWEISMTGASGRSLFDGAWDGWTYDADFSFDDLPVQPMAAVPEPSSILLLTLGLLLLMRRFSNA